MFVLKNIIVSAINDDEENQTSCRYYIVSIIIIRYLQCHTVLRIIIVCKVEVIYTFAACEELH